MSAGHAVDVLEASGLRVIGHTDLGGQGDCMHVNVTADGYAYVGHMGDSRAGTSVVDVRDPRAPRPVGRVDTPPGTHSHKVQVVDDLLMVNYERNPAEPGATEWQAGVRLFDISERATPRPVGFHPTPGKGVHRMTFWEQPYAWVTGSYTGFSDQFLQIVDVSDPAAPAEVGRWWVPGMRDGERPTWDPARRVALHHAIVRGERAYCGLWDGGMAILDVADLTAPTLLAHLEFGPDSGATHTALPLPGRDLLVVTDECVSDGDAEPHKRVRLVDVADDRAPRVVGMLPVPEGDFVHRGGRYGPHNVHENRPGSFQSGDLVFLTYFNAGLRVYDVSDAASPREIAHCVPAAPPGRPAVQLNDLTVTADGLVFVTDRFSGGLYVMELQGA
jgi:hypothetical protein